MGTQSVKILDRVAARTGFQDAEACLHGFDPVTIHMETRTTQSLLPRCHPNAHPSDWGPENRPLLGAQIIRHHGAEISKRIDIVATALYSGLTVSDLANFDLSYTPLFPLGSLAGGGV
ncbi:MAG: hypothetical protein R2874_15430 [Desulfobacterales bacterium]